MTPNYLNAVGNRNAIGWSTRANFGFDFASNTAYGPLIGHMDFNVDVANGLDPLQGAGTANIAYLNQGYLTWAGITAGKAASFFSFVGGGDNWANIFSPDRKGFNQPLLMAYTASFGGGFSATISAESQGTVGASGGGTNMTGGYFNTNTGTFGPSTGLAFGGQRWPDIVGALHVKQGWGEAQLSGVIHNVNMYNVLYNGFTGCGLSGLAICDGSESKVGWALDAGVKFNLPWYPGDTFLLTGAYSQNAVWYSGLADGMWGENGQTNGNGQPMYLADAFFNPTTNTWSTPRAWSVSAILEHHWSPTFYTNLEASIGGISWSGQNGYLCPTLATCAGTGRGFAEGFQLAHRRRPRLEPGHEPQLRPGVDVSEHQPGCAFGLPGYGLLERRLRSGRRVGRQQQRVRGPSPHHPLLLILTRSVETETPERKLRGFFFGSAEGVVGVTGRQGPTRRYYRSGRTRADICPCGGAARNG